MGERIYQPIPSIRVKENSISAVRNCYWVDELQSGFHIVMFFAHPAPMPAVKRQLYHCNLDNNSNSITYLMQEQYIEESVIYIIE